MEGGCPRDVKTHALLHNGKNHKTNHFSFLLCVWFQFFLISFLLKDKKRKEKRKEKKRKKKRKEKRKEKKKKRLQRCLLKNNFYFLSTREETPRFADGIGHKDSYSKRTSRSLDSWEVKRNCDLWMQGPFTDGK